MIAMPWVSMEGSCRWIEDDCTLGLGELIRWWGQKIAMSNIYLWRYHIIDLLVSYHTWHGRKVEDFLVLNAWLWFSCLRPGCTPHDYCKSYSLSKLILTNSSLFCFCFSCIPSASQHMNMIRYLVSEHIDKFVVVAS